MFLHLKTLNHPDAGKVLSSVFERADAPISYFLIDAMIDSVMLEGTTPKP
jgi:hypothetical protein